MSSHIHVVSCKQKSCHFNFGYVGGVGAISWSVQLVIALRGEKNHIHYVKIWPPRRSLLNCNEGGPLDNHEFTN